MSFCRSALFILVGLIAPSAAFAVDDLPLLNGLYSVLPCKTGTIDDPDSVQIHSYEPIQKRKGRYIALLGGEFCDLKNIAVSGNVHSGALPCRSEGARGMSSPIDPRKISFTIIDQKTFISEKRTYRWCR